MSDSGKLKVDPLFLGLTRPPMLFGVSYMMVALNGLINMIYMIMTSDIVGFFMNIFILHIIGYLITFKEPLFLQLWAVRMQKCNLCRNRWYYGRTNSYDVF